MSNRAPNSGDEFVDPDDLDNNQSGNSTFHSIVAARMSRRTVLRGGVASAATALFGSLSLTACGSEQGAAVEAVSATPELKDRPDHRPTFDKHTEALLGFAAVAKTLADASTVPAGYTATTILATGDPIEPGVKEYRNDGTDTGYDRRSGDCHDGMEYFGMSPSGRRDDTSNDQALLGINFEYVTPVVLHATGPTARPRPAAETDIEVDCHGVGIVEVRKKKGKFAYVQQSRFNRRITPLTEIELAGPARGHPLLVTKFSPDGKRTRGTLNNCGTGKTPWGTLLTGEENWSGYFFRAAGDQNRRTPARNLSLARYGRNVTDTTSAASRYGWETAGIADKYARWDITHKGNSADGSDDYRNEIHGQGYITEIDPYDPKAIPTKRTALGRLAHEGAAFSKAVHGKPLAVYTGCDSQNEYIYKFVSKKTWRTWDADRIDRMKAGAEYLDEGTLYVASFKADGTGRWLELSMSNPLISGYDKYHFDGAGDIAINTRLAADAAGATKMDRPEWCGVHPETGEVYFTLTNNSSRRLAPTGSQSSVDAANPRAYTDIYEEDIVQNGNVNGHILRMREMDGETNARDFTWDIYLFGAQADADRTLVNLSGLTDDQDFSSPDGLVFSKSTGICWIQTDDGAYTDVSNCMMLAGVPGQVGDGSSQNLNYGTTSISTFVGKQPEAQTLKRFFVGPKDCEITGMCETPDGKVAFINVQHPGDSINASDLVNPEKYSSQWPSNTGYGAGKRPRSGTVMITKDDGGRIGS